MSADLDKAEQASAGTAEANGKEPGEEQQEEGADIRHLLQVVAIYSKPLAEFIAAASKPYLESKERAARLSVRLSWLAGTVVLVVVIVAGVLTYFDKIDGATFAFLLGLIVGYVLTFIRDAIQPRSDF